MAYAVETFPLGTGGAIRNAATLVESESAMVMNGDSYTDVDLFEFAMEHKESNTELSVVVVSDGRSDTGSVLIDSFIHAGKCVDIGTPDRYQIAQQILASVERDSIPAAAVKNEGGHGSCALEATSDRRHSSRQY